MGWLINFFNQVFFQIICMGWGGGDGVVWDGVRWDGVG